jgi:hypothetical protein
MKPVVAVATAAGKPPEIMTIQLEGPREPRLHWYRKTRRSDPIPSFARNGSYFARFRPPE